MTVQAQILRLLMRLRRELGMALMLITHDFGVIAGMVERVSQQGEMPDPVTDGAELAVQRLGSAAAAFAGTFETSELDHGALLYRAAPQSAEGRLAEVAYFDIHGGGFIAGGGVMCRMLAKIRAAD